jgi:tetratricopeptide (TPR) repeat protein
MYDIKYLEEEWKKYRKKKFRPWYIFGLMLFLLSIATIFILNSDRLDFSSLSQYFKSSKDHSFTEGKNTDAFMNQKKIFQKNILLDHALERLELKDIINDSDETTVKKPFNILVDIPILEETQEQISSDIHEPRKKVHLEIIESTSVTAYRDVEKRFLESHDIDDALFLARSYYKKGDYENAVYWALEINKLDEELEEGLFIFVKSKAKMGRKNEAISILTTYVKKSNSQEAKKLLYRIENDKL